MGVSNLFKVLADPLRREILVLLREGRLSAGEISNRLSVAPTALSYHLKLLKQADLVLEYRKWNYIYYELNTSVLSELLLWLKQFGGKEP